MVCCMACTRSTHGCLLFPRRLSTLYSLVSKHSVRCVWYDVTGNWLGRAFRGVMRNFGEIAPLEKSTGRSSPVVPGHKVLTSGHGSLWWATSRVPKKLERLLFWGYSKGALGRPFNGSDILLWMARQSTVWLMDVVLRLDDAMESNNDIISIHLYIIRHFLFLSTFQSEISSACSSATEVVDCWWG